MLRNRGRRSRIAALAIALLVALFSQQIAVVHAVVPSTVDYRVFLSGTKIFLHNKTSLSAQNGTEYYFTYTVESVEQNCKQHGLVVTAAADREFPYTDGGFMRYQESAAEMLTEGATYFIKITVASGGFRYDVTRAMGDKMETILFEKKVGDATDPVKYVGLWFYASNAVAALKNVRCYDKDGNDLGIEASCGSGTADVIRQDLAFQKAEDIDHRYEVTVDNKYNIAISNVKAPTTSELYIQYRVDSAEYAIKQAGVALSNAPEAEYPHAEGIIKHITQVDLVNSIELLESGAEYIIKIERGKDDYRVIVQKTKNGGRELFILSKAAGTYSGSFDFASLWFGTGETSRATFHLADLLIYDGNRNNLGVQCNVDATIRHSGELEDYAGCEAVYYCKETSSFIALYPDQTMKYTANGKTTDAGYRVSKNILTATFADGVKEYDYLYKRITDDNGHVYERLYTYEVTFVTGSEIGIATQTLSSKTGYQVMKPADPTLKGHQFAGWVTGDGRTFDFHQVVTASTTLYAKWQGDDGSEFIAKDWHSDVGVSTLTYVVTAGCGLLFLAGIAVCVILIRNGRKQHVSSK